MISTDEIKFYKEVIPECHIIFDVGCRNDLIFCEINPYAEVHLFDPMPNSKLKDDVRFNNFALGSKEEEVEFHYHYGSILYRPEEPKFNDLHDTITIQVKRLDDYCKLNRLKRIDYLKIDTEGYDFEVMLGCGDFIDNIARIQFEVFDYYANGKTYEDIEKYLTDKGFKLKPIGGKPLNMLAERV
jgi:FkbM family methyltransferase